MSEKKILYFDYWTVGINNFILFDQNLKNSGYTTKLVHLNSWREIEGPEFQQLQGVDCYDIKYYRTNLLFDVLKKEKPLAVVMLNASFITDRSIILSCKKLSIKSIYLMHGALTREEFIDESIKFINQTLKKNRIKRALKHISGTVFNYLNSIFKYDKKYIFKVHPYKVLLKTFTDPGTYLHFPPPAFDLRPDLTLVYGGLDKEFYVKRFLLLPSSVKVIGNPDLDKYFQEINNLGENEDNFRKTQGIPNHTPYITYIEEGLVEDRIWDNNYRIKFFEQISKICSEAGFHLVIKLHPRTARGPYRKSFDLLENVTVLAQVNFPKLIRFTDKCISHYSTTLIYPILLDKPILVPRWGESANLQTVYSDKEVTFINTLEEFDQAIKSNNFVYERSDYVKNFVPFKDGRTRDRIAQYILDLVK